jgi:hypothetical protein
LFQLFATGVVNAGGNLPPVSTTPAKLVAKLVVGDVLTGGNFCHRCQNLPPVLLIQVVHLDLRISPGIFEKI